MDKYNVEIRQIKDDVAITTMKDMNVRMAEKVKRGAEINLNHDDYYVEIVKVEEEELDPPLFDDNADQEEDDNV